uniref:Uncharacterized protein n=1 Tax=Arundo donax TaxID=35708 RepID=A0A0A9DLA2_ARUDO
MLASSHQIAVSTSTTSCRKDDNVLSSQSVERFIQENKKST